ncbi:hypothetical protein [Roseofilum casamattae]|uniref:Immunity protein Imm1 n=1 Tax=Roseofilum casamattae BLCC-M143 TaxID=3022442 RepID=A0ABT7BUJ6_9CYAN|nr:hypothetical protein [Roseofilum casamattae]MDJ1182765.1 hypothetical protein [Roseofilum casamattae BLCC-M143]
MKITTIFEENWTDGTDRGTEYPCQNIAQVKEAILRLDGDNVTLVCLDINETLFMIIGGGNDRHYVCYIEDNNRLFNLIHPERDGETQVKIVAGRQYAFYETKLSSNLDEVLEAAVFFSFHGKTNLNLVWEEQI